MNFTNLAATILSVFLLVGCATPSPIADTCQHPLDARVANSCVVADETLWRGARPTPDAVTMLVNLGVQTVVSLELLNDDKQAFQAARPSPKILRELQYFQIRDWEPLVVIAPRIADDHIAQFLAVTRTQPAPVYVHCRSGQNRTGVMVAAYRIFNGEEIETAIKEMERYGGFWAKADAAYIRTLTPERRSMIEKQIAAWIPKLKRTAKVICSDGRCTVSEDAM